MQSEKIHLAEYVESSKLSFNYDDEFLQKNITNGLSYSITSDKANIRAKNIKLSVRGNSYDVVTKDCSYHIHNSLLGKQMIYSDLAAIAIASKMGIEVEEIIRQINTRKSYPGRMSVLSGKNNITIIDDTYNANPASVKAALDSL